MCKISYGKLVDPYNLDYEIEQPTVEDIQNLGKELGYSIEGFHIFCTIGTLTIGYAGKNRARVRYHRNDYQSPILPGGYSDGKLVDEKYADSEKRITVFINGMEDEALLRETVPKRVAISVAKQFLEKQTLPEDIFWVMIK